MTNELKMAAARWAAKKAEAEKKMMDSIIKESDIYDAVKKPHVLFLKQKGLQALFGIITYRQLIERRSIASAIASEVAAMAVILGAIPVEKKKGEDPFNQPELVVEGKQMLLYDTRYSALFENEEYRNKWQEWMDVTIPGINRINIATAMGTVAIVEGLTIEQSKAMLAITSNTKEINKMISLARKDPHFVEAEWEERRRQRYLSLYSTREAEEARKALENFTEEDKIFFEVGRRVETLYRQQGTVINITDDGKGRPISPKREEIATLMEDLSDGDNGSSSISLNNKKLEVMYPYYLYKRITYDDYVALSGVEFDPEELEEGNSYIDFFLKVKALQEKCNSLGVIIPKELSDYNESKPINLLHHYHGEEATIKAASIRAYLELSKLDNLNTIDYVRDRSEYNLEVS